MSDTSATTCGSMKMIDKSTLPALAISTLYLDIYCILLLEFCMCNLFSFCCVDAVIKVRGSKAYYPHIFAHMRYDEHIDKTSEDSDFEKGDMEHLLETDDENGNLESDSGGEDSGEPDILDADEKTEDLSSYVEVGEKLKTTNGIDHKDVPQVDSSVKIDLTGVVKITEEADDELSTSLNQEREINRSFDLFMSRHDDNETLSEYAKLLRGLYEYCISFGHRDNTFTALCWRNFNAELKKHEKRKKLKKKDKKKKDDRRVKSLYPGIQELDLIFTDVNKKGLSQFDSFLLAWQTLSAATFFAEKKSTSEITFVYDFGLPLSLKLGTILTEKEARERSLERIMKSDVMKLLFTNNRGILKSMFIHYSIEDEAYVPNDSVHMTLTAWFSFFTDMNISVNKSEVLELRQIYEQTVNAGGGGVNEMSFGSFKSALLRVACHLDRNLRTVKRGGIKAGEAVRALKVMFHSMESEGGLKVASRKAEFERNTHKLDVWQTGSGQSLGRQEGWVRAQGHRMIQKRTEENLTIVSFGKKRTKHRVPFPLKVLNSSKQQKFKAPHIASILMDRLCKVANVDRRNCNTYVKASNLVYLESLEKARLGLRADEVLSVTVNWIRENMPSLMTSINESLYREGQTSKDIIEGFLKCAKYRLNENLQQIKQAGLEIKENELASIHKTIAVIDETKLLLTSICDIAFDLLPNPSSIQVGYERCFTESFRVKWLWKTYQDLSFMDESKWNKKPFPNRPFTTIFEYEPAIDPSVCAKRLESSKAGCVGPPESKDFVLDLVSLKEGKALKLAPEGTAWPIRFDKTSDGKFPPLKRVCSKREFDKLNSTSYDIVLSSTWGFDCSTNRRMMRALLMNTVLEEACCHDFITRVLLPAINRQSDENAHDMAIALHDIIHVASEKGNALQTLAASTLLQEVQKDRIFDRGNSFRVHPKGQGLLCSRREGLPNGCFVERYLGELYTPWRWFEKTDAVKVVQKKLSKLSTLPDFYNIVLDRHADDAAGYNLMYVDPIARGNIASRLSHSCNPNCGTVTVSVDGKYVIAVFALRDIAYGEELSFDYGAFTEDKDEHKMATCLCGTSECKGAFLLYSNDKYFQVIMEKHQTTLDRNAQIYRASTEPLLEEDRALLSKHNLRSSVQDGAPDWLLKWGALILQYADFESEQLARYLQRTYKGIYNMKAAQDESRNIHMTRVQNLVITMEKVKYVLNQKGQIQDPPVRLLNAAEVVEKYWSRGEENGNPGIVREIARNGLATLSGEKKNLSVREKIKSLLKVKIPLSSEGLSALQSTVIPKLRSIFWSLDQTSTKRFTAAGDLLTLYMHTKTHFTNTQYLRVESPSICIRQCDVGETKKPMTEKNAVMKGKAYSPMYIWGQLNFWERQTIASPDSSLMAARYELKGTPPVVNSETLEGDDLPCNVCGLTGDTLENPALLCETCNAGCAHIFCLNLKSVPAGDWFCAVCEERKLENIPLWLQEIKRMKFIHES
eukprot:Stramenopile-MAST_4_protein_847